MNADLRLALDLADACDDISMTFYRASDLAVRTKEDLSPVSEADEAVETLIRERLRQDRHRDAVVGEEFGSTGSSERRWIIDPIDGTRNFVRGVPVFATLLALEEKGEPTIGVVSAPALQRRWWATKGGGAFCNDIPIQVSKTPSIEQAFIGYDSVTDYAEFGLEEKFVALLRRADRSRGLGDFWTHMLVAEGAIDAAIEPKVAVWDMAAIQIIVQEAGGRFSDLTGNARPDGGSGVSTNGRFHDEVLSSLR